MIVLILSGIAVGILASAPLGPAGILCLQRTLTRGFRMGFVSGLGIAFSDTIFSAAAVSGMSYITIIFNELEMPLRLVLGIIVILVGIKIGRTNPIANFRLRNASQDGKFAAFVSIFLLTLNPMNLLPVIFFVGALKITINSFFEGIMVIVGVACGAAAWWLGATSLAAHYRSRFHLRHFLWINRILGSIIFVLGLAAVISAIVRLFEAM
jgi:threonine/homoserine/homoserine lactone efflux protein